MGKTTDTTLRIRAKNLAGKELRDVSKDIDALAESQKKNATAADLAARSLSELKDEQRQLAAVAAELNRRGGLVGNLGKQREEITKAAQKVRELQQELAELKNMKASGTALGDVDKAIRNVEKSVKRANAELARQTNNFQKAEASAAKIGVTSQNAATAIAEINAEARRTAELMNEATAAVERHGVAQQQIRGDLEAQQRLQQEITAEANRRLAAERAAHQQFIEQARQRKAELQEQARIREHLTKVFLSRPAEPAQGPVLGPGGNASDVEAARSAAFRERLIRVLRRQQDAGEKLIASDGKLAAATRNVTRALDENSRSLDRNHKLQGIFADTGRKSLSVYQRLRGQILSTVAAYVGLYQAANLVKQAVTVDQERRKIGIQLKTANNGDMAAATRDMKFLREEADRLGLVFEDVAKNFANFKIAARAVGASNKTVRESFKSATEIVTGLGLSGEDADGVFRAFVQILGKARVQAEELRGQLGDRLPGAVAAFAKANNIAMQDLDEYLKKGKGSVKDFLQFLRTYNEQTKGAVDENSKSLFAQFNRLTNAWRDFLQEFAKAGVSKELLNVVNALIAKLQGDEGKKFAGELAKAFTVVGKVLLWVIDNFESLVTVFKAFLALQAAKAVVGIASSLAVTGKAAYDTGKAIIGFTKNVVAARAGVAGLSVAARGFSVLLGPVGIAVAAFAGTIYLLTKNSRDATRQIDELIAHTQKLRGLQGKAGVAAIRETADKIRELGQEEQELLDKRKKIADLASTPVVGGMTNAFYELVDAASDGTNSLAGIDRRLTQVRSNIEMLKQAAITTGKRLQKEAKDASDAAKADAAEQDNFVTPGGGDDSDAKSKADKERERLERLAEQRRDIADRAAKALLSIEEDLANARVDKEITSQQQIDDNLKASLDAISAQIAKKKIELEGLVRDAQALGATDAVASGTAAISKLPGLQKELEAKARLQAITQGIELQEKKINDLISQRDAELDIINTKVQLGIITEVEGRQQAINKQAEYKDKIQETSQALIDQLAALKASDPNLAAILHVDELIAKLETTKLKAGEVQNTVTLIGKNLGGQFASGVATAFGTFIKGAAGGIEGVNGIGEAFKNAGNSFLNFLADFLVGIGEAILQAIILQAIMNAITGGSGGYTQAAVGALTGHTGGIVRSGGIGVGNPTRQVSAALFTGAQRFHDGGLPGLKKDEVPAILKKGEEVLNQDDPRNALNGGSPDMGNGGGARMDVSVVNAIDSASVFEAGASTPAGRKVIFNVIRANKSDFKKLLA